MRRVGWKKDGNICLFLGEKGRGGREGHMANPPILPSSSCQCHRLPSHRISPYPTVSPSHRIPPYPPLRPLPRLRRTHLHGEPLEEVVGHDGEGDASGGLENSRHCGTERLPPLDPAHVFGSGECLVVAVFGSSGGVWWWAAISCSSSPRGVAEMPQSAYLPGVGDM